MKSIKRALGEADVLQPRIHSLPLHSQAMQLQLPLGIKQKTCVPWDHVVETHRSLTPATGAVPASAFHQQEGLTSLPLVCTMYIRQHQPIYRYPRSYRAVRAPETCLCKLKHRRVWCPCCHAHMHVMQCDATYAPYNIDTGFASCQACQQIPTHKTKTSSTSFDLERKILE
jgi:hypothetical protein